jgi:hypothetical protein
VSADVESPAGGPELFRALRSVAEEYRMRAVVNRDYDSAAIHLALQSIVLAAARCGVHVHMQVVQEGST